MFATNSFLLLRSREIGVSPGKLAPPSFRRLGSRGVASSIPWVKVGGSKFIGVKQSFLKLSGMSWLRRLLGLGSRLRLMGTDLAGNQYFEMAGVEGRRSS